MSNDTTQPAELPALSDEELLGAIARGWCSPGNSGKEMDVELATAIADEVRAALAATGAQAQVEVVPNVPAGPEWLLPGEVAVRIAYEHYVTPGAVQSVAKAVHQLKYQSPAASPLAAQAAPAVPAHLLVKEWAKQNYVDFVSRSDGLRSTETISFAALERLAAAPTPAAQAPEEPAVGARWTPTAENINALPQPVRDYIHALEANCDPAGTVADNTIKADLICQLQASNRRIRDELDTPGNRWPEARYAGYTGQPYDNDYTADQATAFDEGRRARTASRSPAQPAAPQPTKEQP